MTTPAELAAEMNGARVSVLEARAEAAEKERDALRAAPDPFAAIGRHLRRAGYPNAHRRGGLAEELHSFAFVPGEPAVALTQTDVFRAADLLDGKVP